MVGEGKTEIVLTDHFQGLRIEINLTTNLRAGTANQVGENSDVDSGRVGKQIPVIGVGGSVDSGIGDDFQIAHPRCYGVALGGWRVVGAEQLGGFVKHYLSDKDNISH